MAIPTTRNATPSWDTLYLCEIYDFCELRQFKQIWIPDSRFRLNYRLWYFFDVTEPAASSGLVCTSSWLSRVTLWKIDVIFLRMRSIHITVVGCSWISIVTTLIGWELFSSRWRKVEHRIIHFVLLQLLLRKYSQRTSVFVHHPFHTFLFASCCHDFNQLVQFSIGCNREGWSIDRDVQGVHWWPDSHVV
jgi:hypothetical protein